MTSDISTGVSDVLIIGGGPAGSTAATLLAERGWRVNLLEKAHHPRFHIGESLLPMNLPLFDRLGIRTQIEEIGLVKYGAHFISERYGNRETTAYFDRAVKQSPAHAFEVRRSEFDHVLLQNSRAKGAEIFEGIRVTSIDFPDDRVRVRSVDERGETGEWHTRQLVDASGRDTFLANRLRVKKRNPKHASAAIFGHFKGAQRLPGRDAGNISIAWFEHGWLWIIPLKDGITSVGAVCSPAYLKTRGTMTTEDFLWRTITQCPGVWSRLQQAELVSPAHATGNYSYTCTQMYGDRWLLAGDAYAFVDPVFSSGVYLAMQSAALGAEVIDARLREASEAPRLARQFDRRMRRGLGVFSWFIYRFNSPPLHALFINPKPVFGIQRAVVSVLAGNVFGNLRIALPLLLFKGIYYLQSMVNLVPSWRAWRCRRADARAIFPEDAAGDNNG